MSVVTSRTLIAALWSPHFLLSEIFLLSVSLCEHYTHTHTYTHIYIYMPFGDLDIFDVLAAD
jgi:hypothetical protein